MFLKRKGLITVQANQLVVGHVNTVDEVRDVWGEGGGVGLTELSIYDC